MTGIFLSIQINVLKFLMELYILRLSKEHYRSIQLLIANVNEITYGDKLTALGALNMAVATMRQIDSSFEFNLSDYFPVVINKNNKEHYNRNWAM